jgi:hypothetical protein
MNPGIPYRQSMIYNQMDYIDCNPYYDLLSSNIGVSKLFTANRENGSGKLSLFTKNVKLQNHKGGVFKKVILRQEEQKIYEKSEQQRYEEVGQRIYDESERLLFEEAGQQMSSKPKQQMYDEPEQQMYDEPEQQTENKLFYGGAQKGDGSARHRRRRSKERKQTGTKQQINEKTNNRKIDSKPNDEKQRNPTPMTSPQTAHSNKGSLRTMTEADVNNIINECYINGKKGIIYNLEFSGRFIENLVKKHKTNKASLNKNEIATIIKETYDDIQNENIKYSDVSPSRLSKFINNTVEIAQNDNSPAYFNLGDYLTTLPDNLLFTI